MPRQRQARRWVCVLNNYNETDVERLQDLVSTFLSYLIFAREVGDSGTPHLQCYLETKTRRTLSSLKSRLGVRWHCEIARGNLQDNRTYVSKTGTSTELGEPMRQGSRSDLARLHEDLKSGTSYMEASDKHFALFLQYRKGISDWISMHSVSRSWKSVTTLLVGPTGTGKSWTAFTNSRDREGGYWIYPGKGWFDGYSGEETAIFDDFDGEDMPFRLFLRVLDRYPMTVPVKGGHVKWGPRYIWITSNCYPDEWYPSVKQRDMQALKRRIDFQHHFSIRYND